MARALSEYKKGCHESNYPIRHGNKCKIQEKLDFDGILKIIYIQNIKI